MKSIIVGLLGMFSFVLLFFLLTWHMFDFLSAVCGTAMLFILVLLATGMALLAALMTP